MARSKEVAHTLVHHLSRQLPSLGILLQDPCPLADRWVQTSILSLLHSYNVLANTEHSCNVRSAPHWLEPTLSLADTPICASWTQAPSAGLLMSFHSHRQLKQTLNSSL